MNKCVILFLGSVLWAACGPGNSDEKGAYVLSVVVEAYDGKNKETTTQKFETDTVDVPSALEAYSKGVQKYAAVLMHIQQFPDSIQGVNGIRIFNSEGQDVVSTIPQTQRDSIIMNFIQFARRSTIPYYDRVKDFELKLMTVR